MRRGPGTWDLDYLRGLFISLEGGIRLFGFWKWFGNLGFCSFWRRVWLLRIVLLVELIFSLVGRIISILCRLPNSRSRRRFQDVLRRILLLRLCKPLVERRTLAAPSHSARAMKSPLGKFS